MNVNKKESKMNLNKANDETIFEAMKRHFMKIRENKQTFLIGKRITKEILQLIGFSCYSSNPKNFLFKCGIVFFPNGIWATHSGFIDKALCCCKGRVGGLLKTESLEIIETPVPTERNELIKMIGKETDIRSWRFRKYEKNEDIVKCIKAYPCIVTKINSPFSSLKEQSPEPPKKENESNLILSFQNVYSWTYDDDIF